MNRQYPIYTIEAECQDCYKCVRQCPVKAIRVIDGRASVVPELCIACGKCVSVCPSGAKRVRDDLGRARHLLDREERVYVSLAPSWVSDFEGVTPEAMVGALKRLGFAGVSETALGAQQVSAAVAKGLREGPAGVVLSSACPVCVAYVQKYHPALVRSITPLLSPALTHARMLREWFGEDIAVVFIGPCVAKKLEADRRRDLLDIALTFDDLRDWLEADGVRLDEVSAEGEAFVPAAAEEGAVYPVEGGMISTLKASDAGDAECVAIAGMKSLAASLADLDPDAMGARVFVEGLACEGGCVSGPGTSGTNPLVGRIRVHRYVNWPEDSVSGAADVDLRETYSREFVRRPRHESQEMTAALASIGKDSPSDELNCGGCGYNTCREFAEALLAGNAEPAMCVSYMRRLAMRKANALLRCMPSGGVIVDRNLTVIESNKAFARILGNEAEMAYEASTHLAGADLTKLLPFAELFRVALRTGQDIRREHLAVGDRLLNVTIFSIEPGRTVGAIVEDVTQVEFHREQVARKAREVIDRNISTVQDIACRLGEHMVDTEVLLRSIAEAYADDSTGPQTEVKP